jgi:hypothetical protein
MRRRRGGGGRSRQAGGGGGGSALGGGACFCTLALVCTSHIPTPPVFDKKNRIGGIVNIG